MLDAEVLNSLNRGWGGKDKRLERGDAGFRGKRVSRCGGRGSC